FLGRKVIRKGFAAVVAGGAFILAYFLGLSPFLIIITAAGAGLLSSFFPGGGDGGSGNDRGSDEGGGDP
ncbi:MAG: hypothetical protein GX894_04670, partial [Clostridia bacterium]|nr:hypothetical protein [Clostridia bacterium]